MIIDEEHVRYAYNLSQEQEEIVTRAKELLSHKIPNGSMAEIMTYLAAYFVERNDPLLEKSSNRRRTRRSNSVDTSAARARPNIEAKSGRAAEKSARSDANAGKSESSRSAQLHFAQMSSEQLNSIQSRSMPSSSEQSTAVASKRRVTIKTRKEVIREADGRCEYVDPMTGKRCDSRVRVEADHIRMRVFGGSHNRENLRCLCRVHNQFMSEKNLGHARANRWRNGR
jgi:hypothetical protein